MSEQDSLVSTLETFSKSREILYDVYKSSQDHFGTLGTMLREDMPGSDISEDERTMFLTEEDEKYLEKTVRSNPVIIISGQLNCGKTSLVNELLGGTFFPTSAIPCTARIVTIKYSKDNYLEVRDGDKVKNERVYFTKKKVPEQYINLSSTDRYGEQVQYTVEVGLNHELLKHGLQIIDVPGLSENKALDEVVKKCLDGMLQLLIYVIDGKNSLRIQDTAFLYKLKEIAPKLHVIYVCNKVEIDQAASEMDKWSSSDNNDDEESSVEVDRAQAVFYKLQKNGLFATNKVYSVTMDDYHGLSCIKVRKARLKKISDDEYTKNFQKFKAAVIENFTRCVNSHLTRAINGLLRSQLRLFDFFISEKMMRMPKNELLSTIKDIERKETRFHEHIKKRIINYWTSYIQGELENCLTNLEEEILTSVENLEFKPITLESDSSSNHVINVCRLQVREYVLALLIEGIAQKVKIIEDHLKDDLLKERAGQVQHVFKVESSILQSHLNSFLHRGEIQFNMEELKDKWATWLKQGVRMFLTQQYEHMKLLVKGIYLDAKWKKYAAQAILKKISPEKITEYIVRAILEKVKYEFDDFLHTLNQIKGLCKYKDKRTAEHQRIIRDLTPDYVRNLCLTEALSTTVSVCPARLGREIKKGSRLEVYECEPWQTHQNLIGKKIKGVDQPHQSFCLLYCYANIMKEHKHLVKVTAIVFDMNWDFTILQEKFDESLYELLTREHGLSLSIRVEICLQLAEVCQHVAKYNLRLNDLRINNVLVRTTDEGIQAYFNSSKWKDLKAVYPDGFPAFHFAPEVMLPCEGKSDHKTFDAYSMAVLLLLLVIGKYERPDFSKDPTFMETVHEKPSGVLMSEIKKQFFQMLDANWKGSKLDEIHGFCTAVLKKYFRKCEHRMSIEDFTKDVSKLLNIVKKNKDMEIEETEDKGIEDKGIEDKGIEDKGIEDKGMEVTDAAEILTLKKIHLRGTMSAEKALSEDSMVTADRELENINIESQPREETPMDLEQIPVNLEQVPVGSEQSRRVRSKGPVVLDQRPVEMDQRPANSDQIPMGSEQIPVGIEKLPKDLKKKDQREK